MDQGASLFPLHLFGREKEYRTQCLCHSSVTLAEGLTGFLLQIKQVREEILTFL